MKPAVATALLEILAPIQAEHEASKAWQEVTAKAYPAPETKKKAKKEKKLGTLFPGARKEVNTQPDGHVEGKGQLEVNVAKGAEEVIEGLAIDKK